MATIHFSLRFAEAEGVQLDGRTPLHLVCESAEPASAGIRYDFTIRLASTNEKYVKTLTASMPNGQKTLSIPFIVPLEWAYDFTENTGSLTAPEACGWFNACMSVHYTMIAGSQKFENDFTGYTASAPGLVSSTDCPPTVGALTAAAVDGRVPGAWGLWVQGLSVARVTAANAAGALGSKIVSYSFDGTGRTQTENYADVRLERSGSVSIPVTVMDSRGFTATKDLLLTVQPYTAPALTQISSRRCSADGTEAEEGSCFAAMCTANGSTLGGKNPLTVYRTWKEVTSELYNPAVKLDTPGTPQVVQAWLEKGVSYDVEYTIKDAFYTLHYYDYVSSAAYLLHFLKGGTGIAVGKAAEQSNLFDVALPAKLRRDVSVGGSLAVTGNFSLGGVDVGAALKDLGTESETTFVLNAALNPSLIENHIVRCGRLVLYRLQAIVGVETWEGTPFQFGTVPAGWFGRRAPLVWALQNGVPCKGYIDTNGTAYVSPVNNQHAFTELYGIGIV